MLDGAAIGAGDVDAFIERTAAALHKRIGRRPLVLHQKAAGKVVGAYDVDDGSGLVVLDGGPEVVAIPTDRASARFLRGRSGAMASARVERNLERGGIAWTFVLGDSYADLARRHPSAPGDVDLRALLFFATRFAADRPRLSDELVFDDARTKVHVTYSGDALDQDDLDVYLAALALAREADTTLRLSFMREALDRQLGRTINVAVLAPSFARLTAASITLRTVEYTAVMHPFAYSSNDGADRWLVTVAGEVAPLLDPHGYAAVLATTRARLDDPLAKWIHARAYAQRADFELSYDDLAKAARVEVDEGFRALANAALDAVIALGAPFAGRQQASPDKVLVKLA